MKTITPTKIKNNISIVSDNSTVYTVLEGWEPKTLIIPYIDWIEDYIEDLEMFVSKDKLQKKYEKSIESGLSSLVV